ncbi:Protein 21.1 [Giardia lamblia P15]|uniref:Protein 21.1 n=1 Tax=Giardia intestinalis (strain P15) TaxID=658858 RepID=E1F9D2_GIAIA|nr:Protein 21.1 [Giardia lamblia P15]
MSELIDAAERGDVNGVMEHIDQVGRRTPGGRTALMCAAANNHASCVEILVSKEARLQNAEGWTALIYATMNNYIDCAKLLLVETRLTMAGRWDQFSYGTTALMVAATYGYDELVCLLMTYEAGMVDSSDSTALMYAIREGYTISAERMRLIELLAGLEHGIKGGRGMTALMHAAMYSRPAAIRFLRNRENFFRNDEGWTALMYAAYSDNADCVRLLLCEAGAQASSDWGPYGPGTTALMIAASRGLIQIVHLLKPYEQGLQDAAGHTASWHARYNAHDTQDEEISEGHLHVLSLLGAELDDRLSPPSSDRLTLFEAAISGSIDLVQSKIDEAGRQDLSGCTALMRSAHYGYTEVVSLLVSKEQRLQDCDGLTALHYAVLAGNKDCAKLLTSELDIHDKNHRTPLDFGVLHRRDDLVVSLLNDLKATDETPLDAALRLDHTYCAAFLLAKRSKINYTHGYTMLMVGAVLRDETLLSRFIYQRGMRDNNGWTTLMHMALSGHADYLGYFFAEEAGLQSTKCLHFKRPYWKGTTALMIASAMGHSDIAKKLIEVELGYINQYKETSLMHASEANKIDCARLLLEEAGRQDHRGQTALMRAARKGSLNIIDLLIDLEGKIRDESGQTSLMCAASKGHTNAIKHLTKEIGMCDNNGWTALMYAALNGSDKAIKHLSSEVGMKSTGHYMMHPSGTTALMIAAAAGKDRVVEKLLASESGMFDSDGNCALFFAIHYGHRRCSLLLLSEACTFDASGKLCFTKLRDFYQMNQDTEETFITCYENIRDDLANTLLSSITCKFSTFLLVALLSHRKYQELSRTFPDLLELLWAAILGESETSLDELDDLFYTLEESHSENACIVCMSRQPDSVLLPCRHLVICSSCADRIYTVESIWKCPYCRTLIENMFILRESDI